MNLRMIMIHIEEIHKKIKYLNVFDTASEGCTLIFVCSFAIIQTDSITIKISLIFNLYFV